MNIHEYQGKSVLKSFGAPVSEGHPALTVEEAVAARPGVLAAAELDALVDRR